jgi:hypothetical protein
MAISAKLDTTSLMLPRFHFSMLWRFQASFNHLALPLPLSLEGNAWNKHTT